MYGGLIPALSNPFNLLLLLLHHFLYFSLVSVVSYPPLPSFCGFLWLLNGMHGISSPPLFFSFSLSPLLLIPLSIFLQPLLSVMKCKLWHLSTKSSYQQFAVSGGGGFTVAWRLQAKASLAVSLDPLALFPCSFVYLMFLLSFFCVSLIRSSYLWSFTPSCVLCASSFSPLLLFFISFTRLHNLLFFLHLLFQSPLNSILYRLIIWLSSSSSSFFHWAPSFFLHCLSFSKFIDKMFCPFSLQLVFHIPVLTAWINSSFAANSKALHQYPKAPESSIAPLPADYEYSNAYFNKVVFLNALTRRREGRRSAQNETFTSFRAHVCKAIQTKKETDTSWEKIDRPYAVSFGIISMRKSKSNFLN